MATSNSIGAIVVSGLVGECPRIIFDEMDNRYVLQMSVSNTQYEEIQANGRRIGENIARETIDRFVQTILSSDRKEMEAIDIVKNDSDLLAGERFNVSSLDGKSIELMKIDSRRYICTEGQAKGEIIFLEGERLDFGKVIPGFIISNITLLPPTEAHHYLDYKYLSLYKATPAESIEPLYDYVSETFIQQSVESGFAKSVDLCRGLGQSLWTLRGLYDFMQIKYSK